MPDRFKGSAAPWVQLPGFIPFGAGPRICIGLHFALSEAQIVLAHLLARYRITVVGTRPVIPIGRVTIEPDYEPMFKLERI
jgi:unspecific monooxygenase